MPHFNCKRNTNFCQAMRSIATRWFASTGAFQSAILFKMLAVLPTLQCDSIVKQMNKYLSSWSGKFWQFLKILSFLKITKRTKDFHGHMEILLWMPFRNLEIIIIVIIPHKIRIKISCIFSICKLMRYLSLTWCHGTTYFSCYLWDN